MNSLIKVLFGVILLLAIGTTLATTHHPAAKASPYASAVSAVGVRNAAAQGCCPNMKCIGTLYSQGCTSTTVAEGCYEVLGPTPHPCQNELC